MYSVPLPYMHYGALSVHHHKARAQIPLRSLAMQESD